MSKFKLVIAGIGCTVSVMCAIKSFLNGTVDLGWMSASMWSAVVFIEEWQVN